MDKIYASHLPEALGLTEEMRISVVEVFIQLSGKLEYLGHPMASNVLVFENEDDPKAIYSEIGIASGQAELEPLHGRWARLRPQLQRFQRGGKLAPPSAEPC